MAEAMLSLLTRVAWWAQYSFVHNARCPETISIPSHAADVILFDGILAFYTPGGLRDSNLAGR
jgi:hypothetical protein